MRRPIFVGSAFALAMFALGSTPTAACGWGGWGGCGCGAYGYGASSYYGAPAYAYAPPAYYARPAYAYAPPAYYAPPPAYYAPPVYYAGPTVASYLPPGSFSPPGYYAPPSFGVPYSQHGRGAHIAIANPNLPKGPVPAVIPGARGNYPFAAKDGLRVNKPPLANYRTPGISASVTNPSRRAATAPAPYYAARGNYVPAPYYGGRGNYVPTAYYGGPGGYIGPRR